MPRFFIDIFDGQDLVPDELGIECADFDCAKEEALIAARDRLANMIKEGKPVTGYVFRIMDDRRFVVAKLNAAKSLPTCPATFQSGKFRIVTNEPSKRLGAAFGRILPAFGWAALAICDVNTWNPECSDPFMRQER